MSQRNQLEIKKTCPHFHLKEKLVFQKEIPEETNQAWLDLWNEVKAS